MNNLDEKELLARELHERAGEVSGQPVSFQAVRASAKHMQRRRNVVTGAVAAVVATVALPAGVAVNSALNSPDAPDTEPQYAATPAAPTPSAPEAAATGPASRPDGTFPFTIKGLPRGQQTRVSYIVGGEQTLVTEEGEVDLGMAYSQMTPYRDGWLGLVGTKNGFENTWLTEDMSIERTTPGGEGIVRDTEGTRVLYVQRDFNVQGRTVLVDEPSETGYDREQMTWDVPGDVSTVLPIGYLDEETAVFQVTTNAGETEPYLASGTDPGLVPVEGFLRLTSASEANGMVAGLVSYNPAESSCWGVMEPAVSTTDLVWETCEYSLHEFSPDGRFVIASAPDYDGFGPSGLVVLDVETWEPVVEFRAEKNTAVEVAQSTWEDADTVVAAVMEGNEMALVRAELDGRLEAVSDTYRSRDMTLPLWLAEQPRG